MDRHDHGLSAAQWAVMEHLWRNGSLTGRQATDEMAGEMGWNRSTTLTLLRRMEEKGFVSSATKKGVKTFYPALRREEAALKET